MKKQGFLRTAVVLIIVFLTLGMVSQTVSALTNKNVSTWYWTNNTTINSLATGDVNGDGKNETITGGYYNDGARNVAQLCVWDGSTLALKSVKTWYWIGSTVISSVAIGDVDGDGKLEIVTGGTYNDGTRIVAQLCVWDGATLELKNVKTWYWTSNTFISSIAIGDVNGDGNVEIVTGGYYNDGTQYWGQLCVWNGATLTPKNVQTWHWTNLLLQTYVYSIAIGDVDGDGKIEIVTGGYYNTRYENIAQVKVWDGSTLLQKVGTTWDWTTSTIICSVAVGDVNGDGKIEIVTGGYYYDGTRRVAQLCVWDGATLALDNVKTWYWTSNTAIESVIIGDVEGDGKVEIVTGGYYNDGARDVAQLCVWDGSTLAFKSVNTWYWTNSTGINSVAVADVNGDGKNEIITGGYYGDGIRTVAQQCVWA